MALSHDENAIPIHLLHRLKAYTSQFFDQYILYLLYDHPIDINCCNIITVTLYCHKQFEIFTQMLIKIKAAVSETP